MRRGIIAGALVVLAVAGCSTPVELGGGAPMWTATLGAPTTAPGPLQTATTEPSPATMAEIDTVASSAPSSEPVVVTSPEPAPAPPAEPVAVPAAEVGQTLEEVAAAIGCSGLKTAAAPSAQEFAECYIGEGRVQLYRFNAKSEADPLLAMAAGAGADNARIVWHGLIMIAPNVGVDRDAIVAVLGEE